MAVLSMHGPPRGIAASEQELRNGYPETGTTIFLSKNIFFSNIFAFFVIIQVFLRLYLRSVFEETKSKRSIAREFMNHGPRTAANTKDKRRRRHHAMFLLSEHVPDNNDKISILYKKFAHSVWYVAMSYMKDDQLAEDIVQETFLRLTTCPEKVRRINTSQTKRFLFTIAKHCCIDVLRRQSKYVELAYEEYMDFEAPSKQELPLEHLVMQETMEDIRRALARMPERYQTPLELHLVYGFTNKEIASLLNISPNLVGVQLLRARGMINRFLKGRKR